MELTQEQIIDILNSDCLFPTDNRLEIPTLLIERQAASVTIPAICYGEMKRTYKLNGRGLLHFYTEDYRFNAIYKDMSKVLTINPAAVIEPNFSVYNDTPVAFGLQNIYKKRQVGRKLQALGYNLIVDLNVAPKWYNYNLIGVPDGWRSYATRGNSDRVNYLDAELDVARKKAGTDDVLFVVYGGGDVCLDWCHANGAVYIHPLIDIYNKGTRYTKRNEANKLFDGVVDIDFDWDEAYDNQMIDGREQKKLS